MSRLFTRKGISVLVALAFVASAIGGLLVHGSPQGAHAAGGPATAIKGTGVAAGSLNLHNASVSAPGGPVQKHPAPFKVNRTFNPASKGAANGSSRPSANTPRVAASPLSRAGTLLQSFNGVSSADSSVANGFDVEPPDQGLCVGAGLEIELVNLAGSIYNTLGTKLVGPLPLFLFYGEPPAEFLSDPRCTFDKSTDTFFLTELAIDPSGKASHIDVAVLTPALTETFYQFDTTDATNANCPCFADQPYIGIDAFNLYVSGNEFGISTDYFGGAEVFAISKSQLAAFAPAPNFAEFLHISNTGAQIETLQPALTYDPSAPAEYLVHSFTVDPSGNNNSFDHRLGVFAITNRAAVTAGGFPTLSNPTVISSEFYAQPNVALTPNANVLNADDDRMQQVEYINGSLVGALDTAVSINGDPINRDGAAWFVIKPFLSGPLNVIAFVTRQGYIAATGLYVLYPAITRSSNGRLEMAFSISSSTINPSAAYAVEPTGTIFVAASGTGPDTGFTCGGPLIPCRWGDYSAAVLGPGSTNIWMATEYIPPVGSQSVFANWGTRVYEVSA